MPLDLSTPATHIALTFSDTSPYLTDPSRLSNANPILADLQHVGPVGSGDMANVQVFKIDAADEGKTAIMDALQSLKDRTDNGVLRIDVQERRTRAKRDEF
ncbi:hypothetical protein BJ138DRAFT_1149516 [Hygrophoropsis aurantiaca]|uniref:Uncharacterized protein n=1 Tax=Hygrophoropsis aurantiaca TaxID=72124 RepID=A0ACB8AG57_9AGAM|nr:hypothetical protein BJ138DRAFT_1149516 [Hygrophoropsis aurantiaca]